RHPRSPAAVAFLAARRRGNARGRRRDARRDRGLLPRPWTGAAARRAATPFAAAAGARPRHAGAAAAAARLIPRGDRRHAALRAWLELDRGARAQLPRRRLLLLSGGLGAQDAAAVRRPVAPGDRADSAVARAVERSGAALPGAEPRAHARLLLVPVPRPARLPLPADVHSARLHPRGGL